jgi:hypothetical protein
MKSEFEIVNKLIFFASATMFFQLLGAGSKKIVGRSKRA